MKVRFIVGICVCLMSHPSTVFAQQKLHDLLEQSQDDWLYRSFFESVDLQYRSLACPPELSDAPPMPGLLDQAISNYIDDPALEDKLLQGFFRKQCRNFYALGHLMDLYFPLFHEELEAQEIDRDYAFLPIVLSGLNTNYRGGSTRTGLWALDHPRAMEAGLVINQWVDERKSPEAATKAAVYWIKRYSDRFNGDPFLVTVAMARGLPYADALAATRMEVDNDLHHTLVALRVSMRLLKHTEKESSLLDWVTFFKAYEVVLVTDTIDFRACTDMLGVEADRLYGMNPAYHGTHLIPGLTDTPFLLPPDAADFYRCHPDSVACYKPPQEAIDRLARAESKQVPQGQATMYTVQSGDVLGVIADRHGVRISEIKQWNNLRNDRIYAGQNLLLYGAKETIKVQTDVSPGASDRTEAFTGEAEIYMVKQGDSLWLIARKYPGVSADDIKRWNQIGDDIQPGMKLRIYKP